MNQEASRRLPPQAGGAIVHRSCVRLSEDSARVGVPEPEQAREPRVELIRSGDVVVAIDIHCSCGQHIRLLCMDS